MKATAVGMILVAASLYSLLPLPCAWGAFGEIVHEIPRDSHGWFGGVTWIDGYIFESGKGDENGCAEVFKKDPGSGETAQAWHVPVGAETYVTGITYDSRRQCLWLAVGGDGIYQVSLPGGAVLSHFQPFEHPYGMYYEPETDLLWISDNVKARIKKVDPESQEELETIHLDFIPTGIERVGDHLWIAEEGDANLQVPATVHRCTLAGEKTGVRFFLPIGDGYCYDVGDIAFDGKYLWVRGGRHTAIYQVDIEPSPSPIPTVTPSPTPPPAVIESGDYNGDGTSELGVFRPGIGLWEIKRVTWCYFGGAEDLPVPGDYSGCGTDALAIFRPSSGLWADPVGQRVYFGAVGDQPVPADYLGASVDCPAVFRGSSGLWAIRGQTRIYFGATGDIPVTR